MRTRYSTALALAALLVACGGNAPSPATTVKSSVPASSAATPQTGSEPAATQPNEAATTPDATQTQTVGTTLQEILSSYEARGLASSDFTSYAIGPCFSRSPDDEPPFDSPFLSEAIAPATIVERGTVVLCGIRTVPGADVGDLGLVVLDRAGTTTAWGGSDFPEMPFMAAPGQLCREFLADPYLDGWLTRPTYAYILVLAYWFLEGEPERMDVDGNGVPCELLFDPAVVADVWAGEF